MLHDLRIVTDDSAVEVNPTDVTYKKGQSLAGFAIFSAEYPSESGRNISNTHLQGGRKYA